MSAPAGDTAPDPFDYNHNAFATGIDQVKSRPAPAEEAGSSSQEPTVEPKKPAKRTARKVAKAPARKQAKTFKPPIPAARPPAQFKLAIPPEMHAEMHTVVNAWLAKDPQRMYELNPSLKYENTFLLTMLAYGTAKFVEELEAGGDDSVTFADYIPPDKRR